MKLPYIARSCVVAVTLFALGCGGPDSVSPDNVGPRKPPFDLVTLGQGVVADRVTAEVWVQGNTAYTSTWGSRTVNGVQDRGTAIKIWDVTAAAPVLVDSIIVANATTLGDVQVTDDGKYLVVATEPVPGAIVIYDLQNPRKPVLVSRFNNADTNNGVHTAEVQPVNGRLYAFLSVDPRGSDKARLVIVDITNPAAPVMVLSRIMGNPTIHDVFVRDGILMTALWNDGIAIFDIGGGGKGGTVANPVQLGSTTIVGGKAHNIFWYRDPSNGSKRFAMVGEEGPGSVGGGSSSGDVHVVDVADFANPREVAFYNVHGGGTHNFSADESRGILYAAYYNAGVRALNIRGDMATCTASQKAADGRCDLARMQRELGKWPPAGGTPVFIWGVQFTNGQLYASDMLNGL